MAWIIKKYLKIGLLTSVPMTFNLFISCINNENKKNNGNLYDVIKESNKYFTKNSDIVAYKIGDAKNKIFENLGIKYLWFQFRNGKVANIKYSVKQGWINTGGEMLNDDAKKYLNWTLKNNIQLKIAPKINISLVDENLNITYEAQNTKKSIENNVASLSYSAKNPMFKALNNTDYANMHETKYALETTEIANEISNETTNWWIPKNLDHQGVNINVDINNYPLVKVHISDDRSNYVFDKSSKYTEKNVIISYALWIAKVYYKICNDVVPSNTFLLTYNFISWNNKNTKFIIDLDGNDIARVAIESSSETFFTTQEKTSIQFIA